MIVRRLFNSCRTAVPCWGANYLEFGWKLLLPCVKGLIEPVLLSQSHVLVTCHICGVDAPQVRSRPRIKCVASIYISIGHTQRSSIRRHTVGVGDRGCVQSAAHNAMYTRAQHCCDGRSGARSVSRKLIPGIIRPRVLFHFPPSLVCKKVEYVQDEQDTPRSLATASCHGRAVLLPMFLFFAPLFLPRGMPRIFRFFESLSRKTCLP